jgi:D-glycero-D-manno-heptose 1,7-bisphosphate phosphatase
MTFNMWGEESSADIQQGSPDQLLDRSQLNKKYTKPLIAIDRDGVLIECKDAIKTRDRFIPIEGSLAAVSMIRAKGYKLAVIFDQPGISRGELTIDEVEDMNNYMIELFGDVGCPSIDGVLYNMSDSKDDMYAKPKTAMLKRLRDEFRVPIKGGYYVGDRLVDAKMADKANLKPILVKTGKYSEDEKKFNSFANRPLKKKTKVYNNLLDFAESLS